MRFSLARWLVGSLLGGVTGVIGVRAARRGKEGLWKGYECCCLLYFALLDTVGAFLTHYLGR